MTTENLQPDGNIAFEDFCYAVEMLIRYPEGRSSWLPSSLKSCEEEMWDWAYISCIMARLLHGETPKILDNSQDKKAYVRKSAFPGTAAVENNRSVSRFILAQSFLRTDIAIQYLRRSTGLLNGSLVVLNPLEEDVTYPLSYSGADLLTLPFLTFQGAELCLPYRAPREYVQSLVARIRHSGDVLSRYASSSHAHFPSEETESDSVYSKREEQRLRLLVLETLKQPTLTDAWLRGTMAKLLFTGNDSILWQLLGEIMRDYLLRRVAILRKELGQDSAKHIWPLMRAIAGEQDALPRWVQGIGYLLIPPEEILLRFRLASAFGGYGSDLGFDAWNVPKDRLVEWVSSGNYRGEGLSHDHDPWWMRVRSLDANLLHKFICGNGSFCLSPDEIEAMLKAFWLSPLVSPGILSLVCGDSESVPRSVLVMPYTPAIATKGNTPETAIVMLGTQEHSSADSAQDDGMRRRCNVFINLLQRATADTIIKNRAAHRAFWVMEQVQGHELGKIYDGAVGALNAGCNDPTSICTFTRHMVQAALRYGALWSYASGSSLFPDDARPVRGDDRKVASWASYATAVTRCAWETFLGAVVVYQHSRLLTEEQKERLNQLWRADNLPCLLDTGGPCEFIWPIKNDSGGKGEVNVERYSSSLFRWFMVALTNAWKHITYPGESPANMLLANRIAAAERVLSMTQTVLTLQGSYDGNLTTFSVDNTYLGAEKIEPRIHNIRAKTRLALDLACSEIEDVLYGEKKDDSQHVKSATVRFLGVPSEKMWHTAISLPGQLLTSATTMRPLR